MESEYALRKRKASVAASARILDAMDELAVNGSLSLTTAREVEAIGLIWKTVGLVWAYNWNGEDNGEV